MSSTFVACASCARHVRASADRCPFCDAAREASAAPTQPASAPLAAHIGRLALASASITALATALVACGGARYGAPPAPSDEPGLEA